MQWCSNENVFDWLYNVHQQYVQRHALLFLLWEKEKVKEKKWINIFLAQHLI
jgi:hypothetical protein